ncbi:MAG: acetyl-CoA carboxylase biotin carboxyl carrier protein subunit [Bacteroidetes bacterium]|nr:acetyl-CoA carboxylase biotin carboxyl carrier protein subunit [Bacteroidota bacterium]
MFRNRYIRPSIKKRMIQAKVNGKENYTIDGNKINGAEYEWDILALDNGSYHIIKGNQSYRVTVTNINHEEKTMLIEVNGNEYEISIKDKYDLLLQQMGLSNATSAKINLFRAPMPGLIKEISVSEGAEVKKGDTLIILEAMKMENSLKSPHDGKVKKINAVKGTAVEKNQVLVEFE